MNRSNSEQHGDFAATITEKQPNSIKEVVKVLTDLVVRLDMFAKEMKSDVAKVTSSNAEMRKELADACESMNHINSVFENFRKNVEGFRQELEEVKSQNASSKIETERLSEELREARKEIVELKQYSRSMNVEIRGLPMVKDEDLRKAVGDIALNLGASVSEGDIDVVHRVRSKDKGKPNVIVKFCTKTARNRLIAAARKKRINSGDLGFEGEEPVYINEHLCVETKRLLTKARQLKKDKGWKFIWVEQGKILMRKVEKSSVLHIASEDDLGRVD